MCIVLVAPEGGVKDLRVYKRIFLLALIFFVVALLSVVAWPALLFFLVSGIALCVYGKISKKTASSFLVQSGLVMGVTPIVVLVLVSSAMNGLFGGN